MYFWQRRRFYAFYLPVALSAVGGLAFSLWYNTGYGVTLHAVMSLVFGVVSATFLTLRYRGRLLLSVHGDERVNAGRIYISGDETCMPGERYEADITTSFDGSFNYVLMQGPQGMVLHGGRIEYDVPEDAYVHISYQVRATDIIRQQYDDVTGGFDVAAVTDNTPSDVVNPGDGVIIKTGRREDGSLISRISAVKDSVVSVISGGMNPEFNSDNFIKKWGKNKENNLFEYVTLVRYGKFLTETRLKDRVKLFHNRITASHADIKVNSDRNISIETLQSEVMMSDRPLKRIKDMTPVLFIHGYNLGMMGLGGGRHTWGNLPLLFSDDKYAVSEFRWRTAQRFQDAVKSLSEAVGMLHAESGNKVVLVAHSFGGLLARTYIQSISPETQYNNDVSGLITFGTPHSGISGDRCARFGAELPKGQFFEFGMTGQASSYQAGLEINELRSSRIYLTEKEPGYIPAMLCDFDNYPIPDGVNILSAIGLTNKDMTDLTEDGDRVISYAGQRFAPELTLDGYAPLLTDFTGFGGVVSETVMGASGADIHPGDRFIFSPDIYGYAHSPLIQHRAPEVYVNCEEKEICLHPAYTLIDDYLNRLS